MINSIAKFFSVSALCVMGMSFAYAADEGTNKTEVKKQMQVCHNKKQGEWVSYANKGVTFNGACEANAEGKLQFSFPAPPAGTATASSEAADTAENIHHIQQQPVAIDTHISPIDVHQHAVTEEIESPQAIPSEAQDQ